MPRTKSPHPRRERVECVLTAAELTRLDALREHESRSHFLLVRAGVRATTSNPARSCAGCKHHPDYDCPMSAIRWAAERGMDLDPLNWPPTAPACPGRETTP